ncbi:MAG: MBL fold metallo-hydrolase [Clostridia bacterium]|nr:MBL fold metallo-hydrolase [Clostridia bacterium]
MKHHTIGKIVFVSLCVGLALLLALLEYFVPLRTLLPAIRIEPRAEGEMRVHFMGVGEGDCTILEFPDGNVLVVDSGDGSFDTENKLIRYVKGLNATSYSVVATHADIDHYGGFAELIRTFGADTVYTPFAKSYVGAYKRFTAAVKDSGAQVQTLMRYSVIDNPSGAYAVCISPASAGAQDDNDGSTVLFVSYLGINLLLGADISGSREQQLLDEYALMEGIFDSGEFRVRLEDTDILKVSHHGSAYSSSEEWLSLLSPEVAVVTCGRGNIYSHPAAESVARLAGIGADIYRTDELGNIVISIKNGNFFILE